jgi:hypothetical protein
VGKKKEVYIKDKKCPEKGAVHTIPETIRHKIVLTTTILT